VDLDSALLWAHAAATTSLAGLVWVVQVVVYPSFRLVGPTSAWPRVHAHHTRSTAAVVMLPWAVQGLCLAALLVRRPDGVPLPLLLVTGALAATTVVVTAASSVPLHGKLSQGYDDAVARRLVTTNWLRTAAWTVGAGCSLLMVGLATAPVP
jgi:hypothetical protein